MARILNDDDIVNCIFDSDVEVNDLPWDNDSYVDDEDEDPKFLPITLQSIIVVIRIVNEKLKYLLYLKLRRENILARIQVV